MGRRTGDRAVVATAVFGVACLAADNDDAVIAATLHGFADALIDETKHVLDDSDRLEREQNLIRARALIGDEQADQAYAKGRALTFNQGIDFASVALGRPPPGV